MTTDALNQLADAWDAEAEQKRRRVPSDPIAATLDTCAAELRERLLALISEDRSLTPDEYAALHHISPQAVTAWIRRGELEAYRDARHHWHIPASARRVRSA